MRESVAAGKAHLFCDCARSLISNCGEVPFAHAFFVPGRIELLGKHTDYCGGRSLLCTVERGFCVVVAPRRDQHVVLYAVDRKEAACFEISPDIVPSVGHWTNYAMTTVRRIATNFPAARCGCDIAFISDLPQAAGLSSSSAFVIAMFMALSTVNNLEMSEEYRQNIRSKEDLANYLGCCENGSTFGTLKGTAGVGTFGGSQDHAAILCCKPEMLSVFSFCPVRRETDIRLSPAVVLRVVPSGVIAEKTGAAMHRYNGVSKRAAKLVELWNTATGEARGSLREVLGSQPDALAWLRSLLSARESIDAELRLTERLDQFLIESDRLIPQVSRLIEIEAWHEIGSLVDESQTLAEGNLMNQVPQTVALQRNLRCAGAIAASSFGAGFGGSVWGMFVQN